MAVVNLGCGHTLMPGALNVDSVEMDGVDVVWDLDRTPWPFQDAQFDTVHASHVFEHVADPIAFIAECWRILTQGGRLHIATPDWKSENSYTDPTHRRHCTQRSFDYWVPGTILHGQFGDQYASECTFDKESVDNHWGDLLVVLTKR